MPLEPVLKTCKRCGEIFETSNRRRRVCNDCKLKSRKPVLHCGKCGMSIASEAGLNEEGVCRHCSGEKLDRSRWSERRGLSDYKELDLEMVDGKPRCPECGTVMEIDRGRWSCLNEECSIISIDRKKGHLQTLRRVVRDSILYSERLKDVSQISGQVAMLEV